MSFGGIFGKKDDQDELAALKKGVAKFMDITFNIIGQLEKSLGELRNTVYQLEKRMETLESKGVTRPVRSPIAPEASGLPSSGAIPPLPLLNPEISGNGMPLPPSSPSPPTSLPSSVGNYSPPTDCAPLSQSAAPPAASPTSSPPTTAPPGSNDGGGSAVPPQMALRMELKDIMAKRRAAIDAAEKEEQGG
ncbi:MAG: hypothetical protein ACFFCZ_10260 [Promethearchaeota archaeon]